MLEARRYVIYYFLNRYATYYHILFQFEQKWQQKRIANRVLLKWTWKTLNLHIEKSTGAVPRRNMETSVWHHKLTEPWKKIFGSSLPHIHHQRSYKVKTISSRVLSEWTRRTYKSVKWWNIPNQNIEGKIQNFIKIHILSQQTWKNIPAPPFQLLHTKIHDSKLSWI